MKELLCKASALKVWETPDGKDTGARIPRGEIVSAIGESFDHMWVFVETPIVNGWASSQYLVPTTAIAPHDWVQVPDGLKAIIATYGEPGNPRAQKGLIHLPAPLPLSWSPKEHITTFACHDLVEGPMQAAITAIYERGLWQLIEDYGGCYEYRVKRGTAVKTSAHAWGIVVDLNVNSNPLGAKPKMDARIVKIFEEFGFQWGGRWARPDGMHFQRCTGY